MQIAQDCANQSREYFQLAADARRQRLGLVADHFKRKAVELIASYRFYRKPFTLPLP